MKTDKTGKFVVASMADYLDLGKVHTEKDRRIEMEEAIEIEKELIGHSMAWCNPGVQGRTGRTITTLTVL